MGDIGVDNVVLNFVEESDIEIKSIDYLSPEIENDEVLEDSDLISGEDDTVAIEAGDLISNEDDLAALLSDGETDDSESESPGSEVNTTGLDENYRLEFDDGDGGDDFG